MEKKINTLKMCLNSTVYLRGLEEKEKKWGGKICPCKSGGDWFKGGGGKQNKTYKKNWVPRTQVTKWKKFRLGTHIH